MRAGAEYFTAPAGVAQRRYEALRAYFTEDLTVAQAGARAGYTRASMASLLRDFRAGKLELFAPPGKPGPKTAPAKDRARARAVELRRAGLSVHEISARLRAEGTPLNRTGVGQVLAEEGFGRLLRGPALSHDLMTRFRTAAAPVRSLRRSFRWNRNDACIVPRPYP